MSFDYERFLALGLGPSEQLWCFVAFALAFAIKVPLFPVHTWLPDAHVEAPTGGSVILAGVLLKMGTYGFLRFAMPLFPTAVVTAGPYLVALAVIGIVYGALVAVVQPDVKKLVAYSSVSHLGFCVLGLFGATTQAVTGSVYQMLNHGLSTGGLFLLVGMIYERRHTRELAAFGGLWKVVPAYSVALLLVMLASAGLPGLNGFVGEFLILLGSFRAWPWATAVATSGVVLGALYLLWMYQRVVFGPIVHDENRALADLSGRELAVIVPVIALCVVMGLYPAPFLSRIEPSVDRILARFQPITRVASVDAEGAGR
jgi:NADH-quinone oxidoreductase subunit M